MFFFVMQGPRADSYKFANKDASNSHDAAKKKKKQKKPDMNELKQELTMVCSASTYIISACF